MRTDHLTLPLHVVGIALAQLDTIPQFFPVIPSHSIVYIAFKDNFDSVCRTIVTNKILANTLAFVVTSRPRKILPIHLSKGHLTHGLTSRGDADRNGGSSHGYEI
ncbi:hypothetical protein F4820DRAFT_418798 [Hypoxylon rubiginosum]|uniref:Uncharacterized protein n=1 Tax=Hypoxylon rubiginosum TaxID=110542 RepID=A0ACB9Z4D0_9PEZI|nr:hypothetical protein F4820DRAFT_418798 [Hypoxylon rubiginosum]